MVKSQLSRDVGPEISLHDAMRRVNAALRRLVLTYEREFELIARATKGPRGFGKTVAEARLGTLQFLVLRIPLKHLRRLTDRQREIALSVAVGMSNKEVSNRLAIRPATVASHLRVIYKKLDVDCRSALLLRILAPGA